MLESRIDRVLLQFFERRELERRDMGRPQDDTGSDACVVRFLPAGGAQAPAISGAKTREMKLRPGCGEVVTAANAKFEEFLGHLCADDVQSYIFAPRIAAARAVESCQRVEAAGDERFAQHVFRF